MDLHPGENVIYDGHPSWRSVMSLYARGVLAGLVLGAIAWLALSPTAGVVAFVVCVAIAFVVGLVRRIFVRFTITDQRLRIQRGIISRAVQQTRIDRVQNVNTRQSPIDRLLKVGAVDFDTAGTDDSDFTFNGVDDPGGVVAAVDRAQRLAAQVRAGQGLPPTDDGLT
ncbi:MAG: PH domain-containing protein [Solirubrobacteraceae bacterium]|nr:PH domain-containing protein [Solirubrobacteraceae bacterium]